MICHLQYHHSPPGGHSLVIPRLETKPLTIPLSSCVRATVSNRPTTWPSATVRKPSDRSACCGRPQRETPSSGSPRWCSLETSEFLPAGGFTSGSYLQRGDSPCGPPRTGHKQRQLEKSNGWIGSEGNPVLVLVRPLESWGQNNTQESLWTDTCRFS